MTGFLAAASAVLAVLVSVCIAAPVGVYQNINTPGPVSAARKTISWNGMPGQASKTATPKPYWDTAEKSYDRHDQQWEATLRSIRNKKNTAKKTKTASKAKAMAGPKISPYRKPSDGVGAAETRTNINNKTKTKTRARKSTTNTKASTSGKEHELKRKGVRIAHTVETVLLDDSQLHSKPSSRVWKSYM